MFRPKSINTALKIEVLTTPEYAERIELWRSIYEGHAPWNDEKTPSLGIGKSLIDEIARTATIESESVLNGNDFLNEQYQAAFASAKDWLQYALATGEGIALLFVEKDSIFTNFFENGQFFPVRRDKLEYLESCVFVERKQVGRRYFTLLMHHDWRNLSEDDNFRSEYTITNTAYSSNTDTELGTQIDLNYVEAWKNVQPEMVFYNTQRPFFVELKNDGGYSFNDDIISDIRKSDIQARRTDDEYETAERETFRPPTAAEVDLKGNIVRKPDKKHHVLIGAGRAIGEAPPAITAFSPEIRTEYRAEIDEIKRDIEFKKGVAFGTISTQQAVERTATEIQATKQKSKVLYTDLQENMLQPFYENLAAVMHEICIIYGFDSSEYEQTFHWDDSTIITQQEKEEAFREKEKVMQERLNLGIIDRAVYLAWIKENDPDFHKITPDMVEEARAELPEVLENEY